jgi:hypothetical protein
MSQQQPATSSSLRQQQAVNSNHPASNDFVWLLVGEALNGGGAGEGAAAGPPTSQPPSNSHSNPTAGFHTIVVRPTGGDESDVVTAAQTRLFVHDTPPPPPHRPPPPPSAAFRTVPVASTPMGSYQRIVPRERTVPQDANTQIATSVLRVGPTDSQGVQETLAGSDNVFAQQWLAQFAEGTIRSSSPPVLDQPTSKSRPRDTSSTVGNSLRGVPPLAVLLNDGEGSPVSDLRRRAASESPHRNYVRIGGTRTPVVDAVTIVPVVDASLEQKRAHGHARRAQADAADDLYYSVGTGVVRSGVATPPSRHLLIWEETQREKRLSAAMSPSSRRRAASPLTARGGIGPSNRGAGGGDEQLVPLEGALLPGALLADGLPTVSRHELLSDADAGIAKRCVRCVVFGNFIDPQHFRLRVGCTASEARRHYEGMCATDAWRHEIAGRSSVVTSPIQILVHNCMNEVLHGTCNDWARWFATVSRRRVVEAFSRVAKNQASIGLMLDRNSRGHLVQLAVPALRKDTLMIRGE